MDRQGRRRLSRGAAFVVLASACLVGAGAYVAWAATRNAAGSSSDSASAAKVLRAAASGKQPTVMFQHVARNLTSAVVVDTNYAHIALEPLTQGAAKRRVFSDLVCERVYFAGGRGLCLALEQNPIHSKYIAKIFGPDFKVRHEVALGGLVSRARVSSDGRYGATTVFLLGHSYREDSFSTQTNLIDMASGKLVADNLENFAVFRNGEHIKARDFNFWGVTFARDSNRFYATLATGGKTYLVQGDVRKRHLHVLLKNVECPSLSPDNTRIAYKKRGSRGWRLTVLDLRTMKETPLAETRSIDDQVEWLDNGHILYDFYGVWKVRADGRGRPEKFLSDARSPAVIR
jgi:hypothetical protein